MLMLFGYSVLYFQFSNWDQEFNEDLLIIKEDLAIAQTVIAEGA